MVPHLPILLSPERLQTVANQQTPDVQQQTPDVQQQTPDVQQRTPTVQQETPAVQQQIPEVLHQPPTIGQVVEVQTSEPTETITGMSLDEMGLAVDEIMKILQSDRDLMDIVENLDLPEALWQNELAIPDYVLETDYDW